MWCSRGSRGKDDRKQNTVAPSGHGLYLRIVCTIFYTSTVYKCIYSLILQIYMCREKLVNKDNDKTE